MNDDLPSLRVYSDGASRGNPGPSASAFIVVSEDGKILKRHSEFLGLRTNNQAEYEALISALVHASGLPGLKVDCHLDSEVVVKHLNGEYRVKNPELKILWLRVQQLRKRFIEISFTHVPRHNRYMRLVDELANQRLNRASSRTR